MKRLREESHIYRKSGCYCPSLGLLLAQLYIHQTVDENRLHIKIVAVTVVAKEKQTYQPLFIGNILLIMSSCVYWPKQTSLCTQIMNTRSDVGGDLMHPCLVPNLNMPDEEQNKMEKIKEVLVVWVLNLIMQLEQYLYRVVSHFMETAQFVPVIFARDFWMFKRKTQCYVQCRRWCIWSNLFHLLFIEEKAPENTILCHTYSISLRNYFCC